MLERIIKSGRPARRASDALDEHILDVATSLFLARGYANTSMGAIASHARVSKHTLYRRHRDKTALFDSVVRRLNKEMMFSSVLVKGEPGSLEGLRTLIEVLLNSVLQPGVVALNRLLIAEAPKFPELAAHIMELHGFIVSNRCAEFIHQAQREGRCREGDPNEFATNLLWSVIGGPLNRALIVPPAFKSDTEHQAHIERVWDMFLRAIAPKAD